MKNIKQVALVLSITSALFSTSPGRAESNESISELKEQIRELDQKLRVLERKLELDKEAGTEKAKSYPVIKAGDTGFSITSGDSNFMAAIHGVLQVDNRSFFNDGGVAGSDTFLLRRARPILQGTLYRDFDFLFVPDFGGSSGQIFDAYMNYRYQPEIQLRL